MKSLTDDQVRAALKKSEFGSDLLGAAKTVVVVLSQDWCPQWHDMRRWIGQVCEEAGAALFFHEYNKHPHFDEFLELKEDVWNNREIPYLRIYKNGTLSKESNYVSEERFAALLK